VRALSARRLLTLILTLAAHLTHRHVCHDFDPHRSDARVRLAQGTFRPPARARARAHPRDTRVPGRVTSSPTDRCAVTTQASQRASRVARAPRASSEDDERAQDSSSYRRAAEDPPQLEGVLGKIVSSLPDGRKETAPESYGSRPESKTLKEGRYARGNPVRSGAVTEAAIRGEDFEVVESGMPGVGSLVTLAVGAAVLFGVYKVVDALNSEPVAPRAVNRMPETDKPAPPRAAAVVAAPVEAPAVSAE